MSNNLLSDCFDQEAVDFIRDVACSCGCGICEKPIMIHSMIMTDSSPDFDINSLSPPPGCTHWGIYEPYYHNAQWAAGRIANGQFVQNDCVTPADPNWHTTLKGYSFYLEVWVWCVPNGAC
jgi:hypothetical protein